MREVRNYGKRDQSHPSPGKPPPMLERGRRRAIGEKGRPKRMRKSGLGACRSVDESLDDSVEQSGNQSQDQ